MRARESMRTGERSFYAVIPEAILIGNPCFTDRKSGSPIEAFGDDRSKARAFTAETQGTQRRAKSKAILAAVRICQGLIVQKLQTSG